MSSIEEIIAAKQQRNGAPKQPRQLLLSGDGGGGSIRTELVVITPALAKDWLAHCNPNNRKLTKPRIEMFARQMRDGNWDVTHQGIAFTHDGEISDGHHRLHAVVLANVAVTMMVTYGIPHSAVMDRGRIRSESDARKMAGRGRFSSRYVAALKMVIRCQRDEFSGAPVSPSDLDTLEEAEPIMADWLFATTPTGFPASVWGALGFAYPVAREQVELFSRAILGKEVLQPGTAAMTFLNNFNRLDTAGSQNMRAIGVKTLTMLRHQMLNSSIIKLVGSEQDFQWFRRQRGFGE